MAVISMKQLLEAGVHFGHQTRRWNPKMATYIFTERNGIYIIDLQKTVKKLEEEFGVEISLMPETCKKLVAEAAEDGEGIRGMENKLCVMLEDALYEEEDRRHFVF